MQRTGMSAHQGKHGKPGCQTQTVTARTLLLASVLRVNVSSAVADVLRTSAI